MTLPTALQLSRFPDALEDELAARLTLVRWSDLDGQAQAAFLATRADEVSIVITSGHLGCPPELMRALPALALVAINGVGFDQVDLGLARERGVAVSNTPDVLTEDVADLAVGLVIALLRRLPAADAHVRSGAWEKGSFPWARKVSGRRFGVLGLGRIGAAIADRLAAFGPVAYNARTDKDNGRRFFADPHDLAAWADVLVVACAATAETHGMADARMLAALGPSGWLVNVSRGSVVDEAALVAALEAGGIAGAALDVFAQEPQVPAPLRESGRTVLAPHIGSATHETRQAMGELVVANVDAFLAGNALVTPVAQGAPVLGR